MDVTISAIRACLEDAFDWAIGSRDDVVLVTKGNLTLQIRIVEDGEALSFYLPNVYHLAAGPTREACFEYMLQHNYHVKIGMFAYDPTDGEVSIEGFLPLNDSTLSEAQVLRHVGVMLAVARKERLELMQLAAQKADDENPRRPERPAGSAIAELLGQALAGDEQPEEDEASPPYAVQLAPDVVLGETDWLQQVVEAFNNLCRRVRNASQVEQMRNEVWPQLAAARQRAAAAGRPYLTLALAEDYGLSEQEEYVVLFMAARACVGDRRITYKEIDLVYSPGVQVEETVGLAERLEESGVMVACDADHRDPYRLTHGYLDRLAPLLAFRRPYTTLSQMEQLADVPEGPVAEAEWLRLCHEMIRTAVRDALDYDALTLVHERIWPALLELRRRSVRAGETYQTDRITNQFHLFEQEELVVLFLVARAAAGDRRIYDVEIDMVHSPGLDKEDTEALIRQLQEHELLVCCDEDDMPPYTCGPAASLWQLPS